MAKKVVVRDPESGKSHKVSKSQARNHNPDNVPYDGKTVKHRGAGLVDITRYLRGK